jgi:ankyrin repeat protein
LGKFPKLFSDPRKSSDEKELERCFEFLVEHGVSVNESNPQEDTPLIKAVRQNHAFGIQLLLSYGCKHPSFNINAQNQNGRTALHEACLGEKLDAVKTLLAHGASTDISDIYGNTPIHSLVQAERRVNPFVTETHVAIDIANQLLAAGADLQHQNSANDTPIHQNSISNELLEWFISHNANLLAKNINQLTPIESAIQGGTISQVFLLLDALIEKNLPIPPLDNAKDVNGNSILHRVADSDQFSHRIRDILKYVSLPEEFVNQKNLQGNTALHIAVECDSVVACDCLLQAGADVHIQTLAGVSPLEISIQSMSVGCTFLIIKRYPAQVDTNKLLTARNSIGLSFLHRAVEIGHRDFVQTLINLGENINHALVSEDGFEDDGNALHFACRSQNPIILDILLQLPTADVNQQENYYHNTPLHLACLQGSHECVKLLLAKPNTSVSLLNKMDADPVECTQESGAYQSAALIRKSDAWRTQTLPKLLETNPRVLIIGAGFVGSRLAKYLETFNFTVITTRRTVPEEASNCVHFDLSNLDTWKNLPEQIDVAVVTCPLTPLDKVQEFYSAYLSKHTKHIIAYGTTSRYITTSPNEV